MQVAIIRREMTTFANSKEITYKIEFILWQKLLTFAN